MNGRFAKKLRKQIYGHISLKTPRQYTYEHGTLTAVGLRREYQDAKKGINNGR